MSVTIKQLMPPLMDDDYISILLEVVNIIITKNTHHEIMESLNKNYLKTIEPLNNIKNEKVGDTSKYSNKQLEDLVKKDYEAYERIKNREYIKNAPKDIKKKFDEFVDNVFDYENVMIGVYLQNTRKFNEQIDKIDFLDLQKNFIISLIMIFSISLLLKMHADNYKVLLFLDIAIKYSETLQSYSDTLDELTNIYYQNK